MENSSTDSENSLLLHPDTSKGSSVSSGLQEEYNELLKYAVVTPKWEQKATDKVTLPQLRMPADPVTTITQYSDPSSSCGSLVDSLATGRDSAMGSDALETDRPPKFDPPRQTNLVANSVSATDEQPLEVPEHNQTDDDIQQLGHHIDAWNEEYKAKILHQVASMKNKVEESQRRYFHEQQQGAKREIAALQSEISNLQELLHTYEKSVQRKDVVISNLTQAMQSNRSRQDMMKAFTQWKLRLSDEKRI
uniref:Centrosomal protein POC5 n=1 Tax=Ciona savignyi TaxID=51511 RepID=H2Z068_CIOSA